VTRDEVGHVGSEGRGECGERCHESGVNDTTAAFSRGFTTGAEGRELATDEHGFTQMTRRRKREFGGRNQKR
jgi:hypothetical protein